MPFKSTMCVNRSGPPRVFVGCTECGSMTWFDAARGDKGVRSTTCLNNGHLLTIDLEKVPDNFSPIAYDCSPDGSAFAHWVAKGEHGQTVAPTGKRPPQHEAPRTSITDVEDKVDALRKLREYEKHTRPEFENDPILLEAFDRLIARKKRSIMGAAADQ